MAKIGRKTVVEMVLDALPTGELLEVIVVVGHDAEALGRALPSGVKVVVNADYRLGMGSSIEAGLRAISDRATGALIVLADQPLVTSSLLRRVLGKFESNGRKGIVAAARGSLKAPPVLFARSHFAELSKLRGDEGAKSVVERHPNAVSIVRVKSTRELMDVDSVVDLEKARAYSRTEKPGRR